MAVLPGAFVKLKVFGGGQRAVSRSSGVPIALMTKFDEGAKEVKEVL
jgi:hypothetical protein